MLPEMKSMPLWNTPSILPSLLMNCEINLHDCVTHAYELQAFEIIDCELDQ